MNNLFNALGGGAPMGNFGQMMKQFQQFRQTFKGDPRQQVQQMLNSGRVSQADYDRAVKIANQFMQFMR